MKTIKVVAAIIKHGDKICIAQRLKGEFAGQWEFPGGKVEPGETPEQALEREIKEEFEVDISIKKYFMTAHYDYSTFHLEMDCYIGYLLSEDIHLVDHTAIQWIDVNEPNIDWVPGDVQVIERLREEWNCLNL